MSSEASYSPEGSDAGLPGPDQAEASSSKAPYRYLPKHSYGSIEYPGPISHSDAILKVVTQQDINDCFNATAPASGNAKPTLELRYRGVEQSGGPVRGHRAASQKLLMKVVKRRKKGKEKDAGVFTAEIVGSIPHTVKFRSMADWHWTPNTDGPTADLVNSLKSLDYNAILDYKFPELDEQFTEPVDNPLDPKLAYRSLLDLQPTPLFSTRNLPYVYNYKMPNQAVEEEFYDRRTETYRRRYVNKSRTAGVGPISVPHEHKLGEVPLEPTKTVQARSPDLDKKLVEKLKDLFQQRPVWMRGSLLANFTDDERRELYRLKAYIPTVSYIMGTGPFWKCLVRFGYDPIAEPESSKYQRIFFYPNKKTVKSFVGVDPFDDDDDEVEETRTKGYWVAEQEKRIAEGFRPPIDPMKAHVFDGQYLHRERGDYQLCNITDPLIVKYINDSTQRRKRCSKSTGWYPTALFTLIKTLVRIKYIYMWENHVPPTDRLCWGAIEDYERGKKAGGSGGQDEDEDGDEMDIADNENELENGPQGEGEVEDRNDEVEIDEEEEEEEEEGEEEGEEAEDHGEEGGPDDDEEDGQGVSAYKRKGKGKGKGVGAG